MILSCDQCQTKFAINSSALGHAGRKVRCSACGHEWFQPLEGEGGHPQEAPVCELKPPVRDLAAELDDLAEFQEAGYINKGGKATSKGPVPFYQNSMWRFLLKALSIIAIAVLLFIAIMTYGIELGRLYPYYKPILNMLHLYDTKDIKFALVDCTLKPTEENEEESTTVELNVKVVIKNAGDEDRMLDVVRFSIYTKKKDFLGEYTMSLNKIIPAKKEETIEGVLNRVPKDVTFVIVEMGNLIDIMIRDQSNVLNYKDHVRKHPRS